jgi:hypothetical protein
MVKVMNTNQEQISMTGLTECALLPSLRFRSTQTVAANSITYTPALTSRCE